MASAGGAGGSGGSGSGGGGGNDIDARTIFIVQRIAFAFPKVPRDKSSQLATDFVLR